MTDASFLPSLPVMLAFGAASLVLALTPGPAVLFVVARTLAQGRRAGLASVAGVALGNFGNALGASLGLAALFAISSLAFMLVKWAGAAYLVWLGVKALRRPRDDAADGQGAGGAGQPMRAVRPARLFRDGFVVALLNPKTALFFAAFLPQFIRPDASPALQSMGFGAAFVAIAACTDCLYVLAASRLRPFFSALRGGAAWGRWVTGGTFIGLGVYTALSGSRAQAAR